MKDFQKKQKRQLTSKDSCRQSSCQARNTCEHCFHKHQMTDVPFFHTKYIVKSQLLLPSFHQKAVAEQKKDH